MTSKADGVDRSIRDAVRESDAGLRMNELRLAVTVSDDDDVFAEVSINRDRERRNIAHIATAATRGVLSATDSASAPLDNEGQFAEQALDGEATVVIISDRIYRVPVENDWRRLPVPKLSARVTSAMEVV